MSDVQLPQTPADITPSWLSDVLRDAGVLHDSVVTDVVAETIAVGEGFAGTLARLVLTYDLPLADRP